MPCSRSRPSRRGVVHHAVLPPREAGLRRVPRLARPADRGGPRVAGHRAAVHPPGRGDRGGPRRRGRRDRHADGVGQVAVLRGPGPPVDRRRSGVARPLPVPDQGARPGPGGRVRRSWRPRPACRSSASTYDGDTPAPIRSAVRAAGQVVVTNPDMLHSAILPHHTKWFQLFEQLKVIVIDELHTYRGVFGGHVANVLRRLLRICAHYGIAPGHRVLLGDDREPGRAGGDADRATGTARRPERGTGRRAPRASWSIRRSWSPPAVRAGRRSTLAQRWALPFLRAGRQTIVFGRSRVAVELLLTGLRESLRESYGPRSRVRGYRGGYLPTERRSIEHGLRDGEVLGVVATNALELGVDIGRLDVSILAGYPGSVAATWQQFGRAGRRQGTSVAVLVASGAPVDQYVIHHPEFLLEGTPEEARLDPDNLHVLLAHLRAATFELPFEPGEVFGPGPGRRPPRVPRRGAPRPPGRRRALVLVERELPGLGDLAADRGAGERRHHRHDPGPAAGARRGRPVQRPGPRPRAGHLHPRVGPVLRRPTRVARAQGVRPPRRRRPLHLRQPGGDAQAARGLRRGRRRPVAGGSTAR